MTIKHISIISFFVLLQTMNSVACDCFKTKSVKESIKQADMVVSAKVISKQMWYYDNIQDTGLYTTNASPGNNIERQSRYKVAIVEWFKGNSTSNTITITTPYDDSACGFDFKIGESYIIYGSSNITVGEDWKTGDYKHKKLRDIFETNACTRTVPTSKKEIAEIKKYTSR